jgi:hypothetical protein
MKTSWNWRSDGWNGKISKGKSLLYTKKIGDVPGQTKMAGVCHTS